MISTITERRLERVSLALEWCEAMQTVERLVRWALATGKLTPAAVPAIREELRAVAPFKTYITGRWRPPVSATADDATVAERLLAEVTAWEQALERPPP